MSDIQHTADSPEALVESWRPDFIAAYERAQRNAQRQTFEEYWRWATSFLLVGGSGQPGWLAQTANALASVRDDAARRRLAERAAQLGKRIAAEWSKDSACRVVYSNPFQGRPNLLDWGRAIQRAARNDQGDGRALEAALGKVENDLDLALRA